MKRRQRTFHTGRMTDGSDRQEHVVHVWTERYAGRDYEIKSVTDPVPDVRTVVDDAVMAPAPNEVRRADARRVDPAADTGGTVDLSLRPPTPEEVADVLAANDLAALIDRAQIIAALKGQ